MNVVHTVLRTGGVVLVLLLAACGGAGEPTATPEPVELRMITFDVFGPVEQALIDQFEAVYPHIKINTEGYDQPPEGYLAEATPPDLLALVPGVRLNAAVDQGLVTDVTDLWQQASLDDHYPAALRALSERDGKQFIVPTGYIWNAIYYNKQIFAQYDLEPPHTWDEFMTLCDTLLSYGETPLVMSGDDTFMDSLWIDYLDLRLNGVEFHRQLNNGEISYEDDRVRAIFATWRSLVERGCFGENVHNLDTETTLMAVVRSPDAGEEAESAGGSAVMVLTGSLFLGALPDASRAELDFFPFPVMDPALPVGESVFAIGYVVPSAAIHRVEALTFLRFLVSDTARALLNEDVTSTSLYVPAFASPEAENLPTTVRQGIALVQEADIVTTPYILDVPDSMQQRLDDIVPRLLVDPYSGTGFDLEGLISDLEEARQGQ
jgi:multiple sugar transport system substrate-binding protein/raffinose/stachyose/melibiose transport system substrate-binding protein